MRRRKRWVHLNSEQARTKFFGNIYRIIYQDKHTSRQKIAKKSGISLPTIASNLNLLTDAGLIHTVGSFQSTGGRKPNIISYVPDARFALGIDITKNHLSEVLIDLDLNIIGSKRMYLPFEDSESYFQILSSEMQQLLNQYLIDPSKLLGVGLSMPVHVMEDQKTISYATVVNVSANIYERLTPYIPYPFLIFNDANSAGLAESWISGSEQPMIYLSLSNSVGGANMNGKEIYKGVNCRATEFGHMCIVPHGRKCYCGQHGCLDAYCSAKQLSDFTNGNLAEFFHCLKENSNVGLQRIFDDYLDHLALAVNNLRMCYDCDIVLGGNVGSYMADYIELFREKALRLNPFEKNGDFIRICHYRTEASAVGAAAYYVNEFIQNL